MLGIAFNFVGKKERGVGTNTTGRAETRPKTLGEVHGASTRRTEKMLGWENVFFREGTNSSSYFCSRISANWPPRSRFASNFAVDTLAGTQKHVTGECESRWSNYAATFPRVQGLDNWNGAGKKIEYRLRSTSFSLCVILPFSVEFRRVLWDVDEVGGCRVFAVDETCFSMVQSWKEKCKLLHCSISWFVSMLIVGIIVIIIVKSKVTDAV